MKKPKLKKPNLPDNNISKEEILSAIKEGVRDALQSPTMSTQIRAAVVDGLDKWFDKMLQKGKK